ncbi:signal transduction histidine kinase [Chryseobacterium sp. H1D6B]|uniref:sensor histidine kinase n=1 Tax=Chryseobacterium sp. H1D6B TaxID=2940588 RepID=UPI0015C8CF5B|nr:ATP-binding protein [Chryseobacterium sp. H1D6B]MDH6252391.1 signal transduction histidine kinase [Chryseobacterium sp. H1D6B]
MWNYKILSYFLFTFLFLTIKAQVSFDYFSVSRITQDDGLSQGSNYFRYEDKKGFMWITGNDALNRYDGSSVKVYNLNYYFENCPALQQAYGFAEDENNLYIGSTRGLYIYDYKKDAFTLIDISKNISKKKTVIPVGFSDHKIWCFNLDYQILSYNTATKKIKLEAELPIAPLKSIHVYDNNSLAVYQKMPFIDEGQNICFITKNQVLTYNIKTKKISLPFGISNDEVFYCAAHNKDTKLLYIGYSKGIYVLNNQYKLVKEVNEINHKKLSSVNMISIYSNFIALRSENNGLYFCNTTFSKIKVLKEDYQRSFSYSFDRIGRLWMCDDGQGQIILNFKGTLLKNSNDIQNELKNIFKDTGVGNISEAENGDFVVQGIYSLNAKTNQLKLSQNRNYMNINVFFDKLKKENWCSYKINDDTAVIKMADDKSNHKIIIRKPDFFVKNIAFPQGFKPILSSSEGVFWVNIQDEKLEKITGLPNQSNFVVNILSNNRIAISYLNNDMILAKINSENNIQVLGKVLPSVQSFYIQEDEKKHQYWVGTNEGVFLLDKKFKVLKHFDSNNGLSGTYIYGILLDDSGTVWCSHQHGLSSIDKKNFHIVNYDKTDGIQHWDYNNRSFYKGRDGTMLFGGVNGFNYFKPPLKFENFYKPEIYFDEIKVNNIRFNTKKGINQITEINLENDENNISIKALVKDLENGNRQRLMYRFKNLDAKWKAVTHKNPLVLSSLSPGQYDLEFGIYNKFSQTITPQKKLFIHIKKAFYQTFWFWAFLGGSIIGGIILAFTRWKLMKQKHYYHQQLALEMQRGKITADLHDDIGATLSSLQINSAVAAAFLEKNDLPEAKSILNKIQQQSKNLSENIGEIVWSLKPKKDELMTLSTRIRNFANEILGSTDIYYSITIDEAVDAEITDITARKNLMLITKEALNNAAKYSKSTEVFIIFKIFGDEYILEIKDNGIGFNPEEKKGNGIHNMKKRTEEMHGRFELSVRNGTCIKICIPKSRD